MTTLLKILTLMLLTLSFQCNMADYNTIKGEGEVITKELPISSFDKVTFSNGWNIHLIQSSENIIVARANKNLIEELRLENENNKLEIGTKSKNNIRKADAKDITVYYSGNINYLKASSGVKLTAEKKLVFNNIEIKSSSGSSINLDIKTDKLTCKSSSGSSMKLKISSTEVQAISSSGSNLSLEGKSDSMIADSSSGSVLNLDGYTKNLEVSSSSGSNLNAENLKAIHVKANASSGSSIDVHPQESLSASSSSGSSIKYHNKPSYTVEKEESSGGSVKYK